MFLRHVFAQFHDAVGFAAQASYRRGIVECVAGYCQFVDAPKADALVGVGVASNDIHPRHGIDGINEYPEADDRDEPIACMADMPPKFGKTDVEGKEHHDDSRNADEEEKVVPVHLVKFIIANS